MDKAKLFTQYNQQVNGPRGGGAVTTNLFLAPFLQGWLLTDQQNAVVDITGNGGGQSNGLVPSTEYTAVTAANAADSLTLPPVQFNGQRHVIRNVSGVAIDVFPSSGQEINTQGIDASITVADGATVEFISNPPTATVTNARWYSY